MIAADDAALRCDFMETYRIPDYRALPARQAALFACGLRDNSRIKMALAEAPAPIEILLLAGIRDALWTLVWQNTKDGLDGVRPPASVLDAIVRGNKPRETTGFDTPEEFDAWMASFTAEE